MLLLITVMCVIAEKKLQLYSASLYVVVIFIIGGILIGGAGPPGPAPGYAYGEKGAVPPKRLWILGSLDRSGRCDVSNCGTGNNGFWL